MLYLEAYLGLNSETLYYFFYPYCTQNSQNSIEFLWSFGHSECNRVKIILKLEQVENFKNAIYKLDRQKMATTIFRQSDMFLVGTMTRKY